jgi:flavin reductase (DIM6/NTAB) family NADH-FMN oxidoreductase RutF
MDAHKKQTALRMIPYGLFVLTSEAKDGKVAAACINWVTQASFNPPLLVVGVKTDSLAHAVIKDTGVFALNVLGKNQGKAAFTFFKSLERDGMSIGGLKFKNGQTGSPVFDDVPAFLECKLVDSVEKGDHSVFVGEVVNAEVLQEPEGRADDSTLWLKDLGDRIYYGG